MPYVKRTGNTNSKEPGLFDHSVIDKSMPAKYSGLSTFSVSCLRDRFSRIIKENFTSPVLVSGVVSCAPKKYPSFVFFDIRDEKENVSFTVMGYIGIFYNVERKIKETGVADGLCADIPVMLVVEPVISREKNIQIRLSLIDIVPEYTKSRLISEKDTTIERLTKEELINRQKELELPILIKRLGLITSEQGTSVRDILSAMGGTAKCTEIIFQPVRVEGRDAIQGIIAAVHAFSDNRKRLNIDAIVIARGGGSVADLAPFDDYNLCRAVCLCDIPIITAIGHDKDEHAIELCSCVTPIPSTPSGIGAFLKNKHMELEQDLLAYTDSISRAIHDRFKLETHRLLTAAGILRNKIWGLKNIRRQKIHILSQCAGAMTKGIPKLMSDKEKEICNLSKIIEAYDHRTVLKRGYAVIFGNEKVIKRKQDMPQTAQIEFYDGTVDIRRKD